MGKYCVILMFLLFINNCVADEGEKDSDNVINEKTPSLEENLEKAVNYNIDETIKNIEDIIARADKARREGIIPVDQIKEAYSDIACGLEDIADSLNNSNIAYKFLNANGIERIIISNIASNDESVTKQLLLIIKSLFDVIPVTSKAVMPNSIVDKLLDVFENKESVPLKEIALDIMYAWLPNNPELQARVMRVKGLQPFYDQLSNLDAINVNKLLDLFNIILQEHIMIRENLSHNTKHDYKNIKLYKMIGLIERMSTPIVCNGLLNIFDSSINDNNISLPAFKLVKNSEKFCFNIYKGKPKAIKLFTTIYNYLLNENEAFLNGGMNVTEEKQKIGEYLDSLKIARSEL